MTRRQLGYESQKFIMLHLDPVARILLACRCPALKSINKLSALKIPFIRFNSIGLQINRTYFKFGVVRNFTIGEVPDCALEENQLDGLRRDLDQFGEKSLDDEDQKRRKIQDHVEIAVDEIHELQKSLAVIEHELWNKRVFMPVAGEMFRVQELEAKMKLLNERIKHLRAVATVRHYHTIQLTIRSLHRREIKVNAMYDRRVHLAEHYFLKNLFSQHPNIQVQCMFIDRETDSWKFQFPLQPRSMTIQVLSIEGKIANVLDIMQPVLASHFRTLELKSETTYDHFLIENVIELHIVGRAPLNCLCDMTNRRVVRKSRYSSEMPRTLVRNWIARNLPVGYHYTLEMKGSKLIKDEMNSFGSLVGGTKGVVNEPRYPRFSWTFRLSETTELNVFPHYIAQQDAQEDALHYLQFMIHPRGYARPYQWTL